MITPFWERAPAFFYAILFFLGNASALAFDVSYLIPTALCCFTYHQKIIKAVSVFIAGFLWAFYSYSFPSLQEEGVEGEGSFKVQSIVYGHSPFQKSILFKGILKEFLTSEQSWRRIPCSIYFSGKHFPPLANQDLRVTGKLIQKEKKRYVLKLKTAEKIPRTFSLAQWRFDFKSKIRSIFEKNFSNSKSRSFLFSMLTGETDDRLLALEFNRIGILHLIGISGFQFTLLAFLLTLPLRTLFSHKTSCLSLMILLSLYAFVLGDSPPIERAWISSMLYLTALLLGYNTTPLNVLGIALFWSLAKEPVIIFSLGFQFTFLCTAAILMTYPLIRSVCYFISPKRPFREAILMTSTDQVGQLLSFFFRETLALNMAIHLVTLPLILYQFYKFPFLSLLYNLFLPAVASLLYVLLILGMVAGMTLPVLGVFIHRITESLTVMMLNLTAFPPALYDFQWRVPNFSLGIAVVTLTAILFFSVFLHKPHRLVNRIFG